MPISPKLSQRVLLVDDDKNLPQAIEPILSGMGLITLNTRTTAEAKKVIENDAPHLILLDIRLENENGMEFLRYIHSDPVMKKIPVIMFSGFLTPELVSDAVSLGAVDLITKPFTTNTLTLKIRKAMNSKVFLSHRFDASKFPQVTATVPGQLSQVNEVSLVCNGPMKVGPNTPFTIESALFQTWGCHELIIKTAKEPTGGESGTYTNQAYFVGMTEKIAQKIRKAIYKWRRSP